MGEWTTWTDSDAAASVNVPREGDDKYTRGVLGIATGSAEYPGAAVLGVEAAIRTGLGMVRYLGPRRSTRLVLGRRPEAVTQPGRVQAWLIGSGIDAAAITRRQRSNFEAALASGLPVVVDAGALSFVPGVSRSDVIVTPHRRELAQLLGSVGLSTTVDEIAKAPEVWSARAAERLGVTVLLKGSTTFIADAQGTRIRVTGAPGWLATAGTGDVLAGILGALAATQQWDSVATGAGLPARLAASAALIHGLAAQIASDGGPIAALDVAECVPAAISRLLAP